MPSLGEIELWQTVWGAFLGNMATGKNSPFFKVF